MPQECQSLTFSQNSCPTDGQSSKDLPDHEIRVSVVLRNNARTGCGGTGAIGIQADASIAILRHETLLEERNIHVTR